MKMYLYGMRRRCKGSLFVSVLVLLVSISLLIPAFAGCKKSDDNLDWTNGTTTDPSYETSASTVIETSSEKAVTETAIESLEETTKESAEETTEDVQEETTKETTSETTSIVKQPSQPAPQVQEKPKSPYYLYAEKGSYTLGVYALDSNNNYTKLVKTFRMAIGRGSMTPSGKFTLGKKERWHSFGRTSFAQYSVYYNSYLLIHGPIYYAQDYTTLNPNFYETIGTSHTSGCLRLTTADIYWINNNVPSGTTLEIVNGSPRGLTSASVPVLLKPNIDPTDPAWSWPKPQIKVSSTAPNQISVRIDISYDQDAPYKEFRIGQGDWRTYSGPVTITANSAVSARIRDYVGKSTENSVSVNNIYDPAPPARPTLSISTSDPTNLPVVVTINYSSDSSVKQYSIGSQDNWQTYSAPLQIKDNTDIFARAQNTAGKWSETGSVKVSNIDKTPPSAPEISVIALPEKATVTITYSDDSTVKEYKIGSGAWISYSGAFDVMEDVLIQARAVDAAGNEIISSEDVSMPPPEPPPTAAPDPEELSS